MNAAAANTSVNLVSKITLAKIGDQPKAHSITEKTKLATLYGRVKAQKEEDSVYGVFVRFTGEFEGVNIQTGEVFRSGSLIVPSILESLLSNAFEDHDGIIDFAVEIGASPTTKGNTGYEYTVRPLVAPAVSDELASLRNLALQSAPALAASKAGQEKQPTK